MDKFDPADYDLHDDYNFEDIQPPINKEKSVKFDEAQLDY